MPQLTIVANSPIATIVKSTVDDSFVLFTADFATGAVSSAVLPVGVTDYLADRLRQAMTALPSLPDTAFPGLVRSLASVRQVEAGATLANPAHILVSIPMSSSSAFIDSRTGAAGGTGTGDIARVTYLGTTATFTIGVPVLVSIAVTPDTPTIASWDSLQFVATGTYSDLSTADITALVTWASDTPGILTIAAAGLATGTGSPYNHNNLGTSTVSATLGLIAGDTLVTTVYAWRE